MRLVVQVGVEGRELQEDRVARKAPEEAKGPKEARGVKAVKDLMVLAAQAVQEDPVAQGEVVVQVDRVGRVVREVREVQVARAVRVDRKGRKAAKGLRVVRAVVDQAPQIPQAQAHAPIAPRQSYKRSAAALWMCLH